MPLLRFSTIAVAALVTVACGPTFPSDAKMTAAFTSNRVAFEQVRDVLLRSEVIERVEQGGAEFLPLPASQRKKIASLMTKADVSLIRVTKAPSGPQWVEFVMHSSGFAFGGAAKTLVWSNKKPSPPLLESLDDPTDRRGFVTANWFKANRLLEEGWYLSLSKG